MKLANKYELFDPVTTGKVETFVARDLASGERVLVYIFEGGPPPSDPPTSQWALEAFAGMAPVPPGEVIDVGRYTGTAFAYLVTKVPEAEELQKWIAAYESFSQNAPEIQMTPSVSATSSPVSGSVTHPVSPESGLGTAAFFPPSKATDTGSGSPRPRDTQSVPAPVAVPDRIPTRPRESFTGVFQSAGIPVEPGSASVRGNEGKAGEFTSFFRGPFTGQASADTPNLTPRSPEPDSHAGEFTQIFGGGRGDPEEAPAEPSLQNAGLNEPGGFTQLFASPVSAQSSPTYEPPTFPKEEKPVSTENPFVFDKPTWEPQIPAPPQMPVPPRSPFESMPVGIPPLPAGGPSEYTMIVSGGMRSSAPPDEPPIAGGTNPPGASSAGFAMPHAPMFPPVPAPGMPAAPHMPSRPAAPQMPGFAAPAMPKAPEAPKPPVSYLPLILILTVLFFFAVLLVLYFALKH
ncbi:MAG: hypothetical protein WB952_15390 [Terriglobales bacterium]